jgi:hypothetical protein
MARPLSMGLVQEVSEYIVGYGPVAKR